MLTATVFRSEDLSKKDRFDAWRQLMSSIHAPMAMSSDHASDFHGHQRLLKLGPVTVWPATFDPMVFQRTPKLIRQSDPEVCHVSLPLRGLLGVVRGGHETEFGPFEMHPNDSSRASEMRTSPDGQGVHQGIGVEVPKELIPLPRRSVEDVIGRKISGREGVGALLAGFITRLAEDADSYQASDGPRLGTILVDLVAAAFASTLEADTALPPETYQRTLLLRLKAFIRQNIHDHDLTPGRVAAAHHISTSYLHRLFKAESITVASYIRRHRLEGARSDLADPALRTTPIHVIAARWGFPGASDFSRAFRAAYGIRPKDHRHQAFRARTRFTHSAESVD